MILAAGLSPAWQQIVVLDRLQQGEVNRARSVHWCGSGKVLNAGLALHHLGAPTRTLSVIGGLAYAAIDREFQSLGLSCRWIECDASTRVCTTVLDQQSGEATELVENAPPLTSDDLARFIMAYEEEAAQANVTVLTCSLPAGTPRDFYRQLLQRSKAIAVLDVRGPELWEALAERPLVVKPNREELGHTVGYAVDEPAAFRRALREVSERGAQWIVVTQGKHAVWVAGEGRLWRLQPPKPAGVVNPIGCGDSLAAGVAWSIHEGHDLLDAVRFGIGAAVDNLANLLPARLDPERVRKLAEQVTVEEESWAV